MCIITELDSVIMCNLMNCGLILYGICLRESCMAGSTFLSCKYVKS